MIRRQTTIVFSTPREFEPAHSETFRRASGTVGLMETAIIKGELRTAIDGRESQVVSRRGHIDPVKAREIALTKGAIDDEIEVSYYEIKNLRSAKVAKFIINSRGEPKPLKVTI